MLFDFDKSTIKPEATQILDRLVAFMNENKDKSANLAGYTDNVGTEAYNQGLSERRVNSVKIMLLARASMAAEFLDKVLAKVNRSLITRLQKVEPRIAGSKSKLIRLPKQFPLRASG